VKKLKNSPNRKKIFVDNQELAKKIFSNF